MLIKLSVCSLSRSRILKNKSIYSNVTLKVFNFRTHKLFAVITQTSFHREIYPKSVDEMANSVDPDQSTPLGAV